MRLLIAATIAALTITAAAADASGPPAPKPGHSLIKVNLRHRPRPRPPADPQPPPNDENTCEPTPPSCTGQWCTSCTDGYCLDIDGTGASASICDGELSWCTDGGNCDAAQFMLKDLTILESTAALCEFSGPSQLGCSLTCGDSKISCSLRPHSGKAGAIDSHCVIFSGEQGQASVLIHHNVCG